MTNPFTTLAAIWNAPSAIAALTSEDARLRALVSDLQRDLDATNEELRDLQREVGDLPTESELERAVESAVEDAVGDLNIEREVEQAVERALDDQLEREVERAVEEAINEAVEEAVEEAVTAAVGALGARLNTLEGLPVLQAELAAATEAR